MYLAKQSKTLCKGAFIFFSKNRFMRIPSYTLFHTLAVDKVAKAQKDCSRPSLVSGKAKGQNPGGELYKKDLHDPDNHDGVITNLKPDILEYEVKWALESIPIVRQVEQGKGVQNDGG